MNAEEVDLRDQRYQQRRCYKLVSLIHVNRKLDFFFVVAARVVAGRRHECPILYELVEEVVPAVHKGFIKVLIVDRGLIDGERMGQLKQKLAIDTIVPLRTNMDLYADALGLTRLRGFAWEPYEPPVPPSPPSTAPAKPLRVQKREAKRQRTLAERKIQAAAFRFVRCGATRAGAARASDLARPRSRSAELEPVSGAANGGGESGAGRVRPNARLGSGDHFRTFHRRADSLHLRTPTGHRNR